jgi:hypothetical protein
MIDKEVVGMGRIVEWLGRRIVAATTQVRLMVRSIFPEARSPRMHSRDVHSNQSTISFQIASEATEENPSSMASYPSGYSAVGSA